MVRLAKSTFSPKASPRLSGPFAKESTTAFRLSRCHPFWICQASSARLSTSRGPLSLPDENPQEGVVGHHHKADFSNRFDRDIAVLWRAPVVVTTSVQFFEALAASGPSEL